MAFFNKKITKNYFTHQNLRSINAKILDSVILNSRTVVVAIGGQKQDASDEMQLVWSFGFSPAVFRFGIC